jgi:type I restriction enzyme S subunit
MKAGWQKKPLGDVAEVIAGQSPEGSYYNISGDGLPFYQGKKEFGERYIGPPNTWTNRTTKIALEGDVLMSVRAPVGPVNLATEKSCIGRGLAAIRSGSCLDKNFLFYFLFSKQDEISGTEGAVFASINKAEIQNISIPIPPLPEQKRLVRLLDEAFDRIATVKANSERNLQNASAIFESNLEAVFVQRGDGWVEKKLEQIGTTQTGSTPKTSEKENFGDFISFIKPADFNKDGSLNYKNDGLSELGLSKARSVSAGSVLMVCIGATIGKCGFCDQVVTTNQQINVLMPFDGIFYKFVYYYMLTKDFQRHVLSSSSQATLPIINKSKWSVLKLALPPMLEEQKNIASGFDTLREETQRLESIYHRKLANLDELKKSLLHQAFNGEL